MIELSSAVPWSSRDVSQSKQTDQIITWQIKNVVFRHRLYYPFNTIGDIYNRLMSMQPQSKTQSMWKDEKSKKKNKTQM